ncbi:MAG: DUF4292 domain-containing protein [Bacteroidaceae bacterium]|nr:DUF4292 domain-containing protein [Bacteroidaceae bacterium]
MHIKKSIYVLFVACGVFSMASCSTTKKNIETIDSSIVTDNKFLLANHIESLSMNYPAFSGISSKIKVKIDANGKTITTSGTLKMKKDEIIQLTLIDPILGLMEVGRMEFSPSKVVIIDRINKQYVDVPYSDVDFLKKANIDFNTLQALFWNEIFQPGRKSLDVESFKKTNIQGNNVEIGYQDKMLYYQFTSDFKANQLKKTSINNPKDKKYDFFFKYDDFVQFNKRQFPKDMVMTFMASGQTTSLDMELGTMKILSEEITPTTPSSKYTKADSQKIFKMLVR